MSLFLQVHVHSIMLEMQIMQWNLFTKTDHT